MTYSHQRYGFGLDEDYDLDDARYDFDSDALRAGGASFDRDYVGGIFSRYGVGGGSIEQRAVATQAMVQTFVNTFAGAGRRYEVTFDPSIGTAATSFEARKVAITPRPLFDTDLTTDEAGSILTGMAAHEVSHDRYGIGTAQAVRAAFADHPNKGLAAKISNILDDVRIESRFGEEYPGYAGIFDPMLKYVAEMTPKKERVIRADDAPTNICVGAVRFAKWMKVEDAAAAEVEWWQRWSERWAKEDAPARHVAGVREAVAHINEQGGEPEPRPEPGDGPGGQQPGSGQPGEGGPGKVAGCGRSGVKGSADVDKEQRQIAQEAVAEASFYEDNGAFGKIAVHRSARGAMEHEATRRVQPSGAASSAIKIAFMRSRTGHTAVETGRRSGRLDNRGLHKVAERRADVFTKKIAPSPRKVNVMVMVDCSSSMHNGIDEAASVAMALADGVRSEQHIRMSVWGWGNSFGLSSSSSVAAVRVWSSGDAVAAISDLTRLPHGGTPDAAAMNWAGLTAKKESGHDERPIVFFLSDGFGSGKMNKAVDAARKAGVEVRGVAVGGMVTEDQLLARFGRGGYIKWEGSIEATARPLARMIVEATK